jgi:hypothetical protein
MQGQFTLLLYLINFTAWAERTVGRRTASQIASASAESFLLRHGALLGA